MVAVYEHRWQDERPGRAPRAPSSTYEGGAEVRINISMKLFAGFAVALAILLVISVVAYQGTGSLVSNQGDVNHTHEVLEGWNASSAP